ncbi:MAG: cobalamin-dependent protein, partial [Anaerolineales bacterium]
MTSNQISKKPRYNLNLVLQETGIKADTLRAWERRYQLPSPERSEGGHRLFSDFDIATVKWLLSKQNEGIRISQAVDLWRQIEEEGQNPLEILIPRREQTAPSITSDQNNRTLTELQSDWVAACLEFNETKAEHVIARAFAQFPLEMVCTDLIYPGLAEVGNLWFQDQVSVQQEHFASELAARKIQALISAAPQPIHHQRILVGCPPSEHHTLSALMVTLLLRYRGWDVLYLGGNLPTAQLLDTIVVTTPDLVILTASQLSTAATLLDTVNLLQDQAVPVVFGGWIFNQVDQLASFIPGYFAGQTLSAAIPRIEEIIQYPRSGGENKPRPTPFSSTISIFTKKKSAIENQALEFLTGSLGNNLPITYFQGTNEFLGQGIMAALALGDLKLLDFDLDWVKELLKNLGLSHDLLPDYLRAYSSAVNTHLGDQGKT